MGLASHQVDPECLELDAPAHPMVDDLLSVQKEPASIVGQDGNFIMACLGHGELSGPADAEILRADLRQLGAGLSRPIEVHCGIRLFLDGGAFEVGVIEIFPAQSVSGIVSLGSQGRAGNRHMIFGIGRRVTNGDGIPGALRDAFQGADRIKRSDFRTSVHFHLNLVRGEPDHGDGVNLRGVQGQNISLIFQEDDSLLGHFAGEFLMLGRVDLGGIQLPGAVQQSGADDGAQNAMHVFVDGRGGRLAVLQGQVDRRRVEIFRLARHLKIVAGVDDGGRLVATMPIGHHHAIKSPSLLQYVGQEITVGAGVDSVNAIVGGHQRPYVALLHSGLERRQINFTQGALAYLDITLPAIDFFVITGEMLDAGGCTRALHSQDITNRHPAGEERVFAEVFSVAATQWRTLDIDRRPEQNLASHLFVVGFITDGRGGLPDQGRVPSRRHYDAAGESRGGAAVGFADAADASAGIGHAHRGDLQPRNGHRGVAAGPADERDFFVEGEPAEEIVHPVLKRGIFIEVDRVILSPDLGSKKRQRQG